MGEQCADVCDRCGNTVVKEERADSSDMVSVKNLELLYLSDEYLPGKTSRPSLTLNKKILCPDCLANMILRWAEEIKSLKKSDVRHVVDAK